MRNPNRYAALLRVRKQEEDRKAQELAQSRQAVQHAQRQRSSLELTRRLALEQAGESLRAKFDAAEIRSYYQYERHLAHLRDQKDAQIREFKSEEAARLEVLTRATQARRIAEKLHERRRDQYQQLLDRDAQQQLDETATMYAARGRKIPMPLRDT